MSLLAAVKGSNELCSSAASEETPQLLVMHAACVAPIFIFWVLILSFRLLLSVGVWALPSAVVTQGNALQLEFVWQLDMQSRKF